MFEAGKKEAKSEVMLSGAELMALMLRDIKVTRPPMVLPVEVLSPRRP